MTDSQQKAFKERVSFGFLAIWRGIFQTADMLQFNVAFFGEMVHFLHIHHGSKTE